MPGRYYIKTFGCQMNEYDSTRMGDVLAAGADLTPTDDPAEADVLLMNTCSVREKAEDKVYSLLGEWRALKKLKPGVLIGVGGCVASQEGEGITKRAPYRGPGVRPADSASPARHDRRALRAGRAVVDVSFPEVEKFDNLPAPRAEGSSAYVSIMEGCSKYCTFCVVPYTRGDEVSRGFESVLDEVRSLASQGVGEIHLLGQNVNAYAGEMDDGTVVDLATLIHYVAAVDGVQLIRFTTSHPVEFGDSLIEAYANIPKLANQLHLAVQSGSDRILSAMKRGYTALEFKEKLRRLRAVRPDISVSTDIIVGFPGETERDFEATLKLVREANFDQSFTFIYSQRPGTPAASLRMTLRSTSSRNGCRDCRRSSTSRRARSATRWSARLSVCSSRGRPRKMYANSPAAPRNGRWVNFAGPASLIGHFVDVAIVEARPQSLRGRFLSKPFEQRLVANAGL
jgi:tRNA-2-methylthio-N6-dimethylallyladenosine synthase